MSLGAIMMRLVIVEDDLMLADFVEAALIEQGHEVCGMATGVADAVALVRFHHPDIAILDMQLGKLELGTQVAEQLAASNDLGGVAILYVTGGAERVLREARVGQACLSKPYSLDALGSSIDIARMMVEQPGWLPQTLPHGLRLIQHAVVDPRVDAINIRQSVPSLQVTA
jgi:DNA-binding response OmpR family regulator